MDGTMEAHRTDPKSKLILNTMKYTDTSINSLNVFLYYYQSGVNYACHQVFSGVLFFIFYFFLCQENIHRDNQKRIA
jgi:hypothetical protein